MVSRVIRARCLRGFVEPVAFREELGAVIHEDRHAERVVFADNPLQCAQAQVENVAAGLGGEFRRGGRRLVEEFGFPRDGGLLAADVVEQGVDFRHAGFVRFIHAERLFQIPFQCPFLNLQGMEPALQFMRGRLADFLDLPLEFLEHGFRLSDLLCKRGGIFWFGFHGG